VENKKQYVKEVIRILKKHYPDSKIALNFDNTFQLLVAVILSAQCTDVRVNKVTPILFKKFPTIEDFAKVKNEELEKYIYSTGLYKNKAKNIIGAARKILSDFNGKVPSNKKDLLTIPSVARKTANVILRTGFGIDEGIVVDTHVIRVSGLLGLASPKYVKVKNAVKIEQELMEIVPKKDWGNFSFLLIDHGRKICIARRPKCEICPLNKICPSSFV
jgi:endonuclease-3